MLLPNIVKNIGDKKKYMSTLYLTVQLGCDALLTYKYKYKFAS